MSSCFDCGSPVAPEDRFCGNCGIALQPVGAAEGEGAHAPSSASLAGEPSSPALQASQSGDAQRQDEAGGQHEHTPAAHQEETSDAQDYSEELQPTLIESSRGGGQATAAARAHEPAPAEVSSSDQATPSSDEKASADIAASSDLASSSDLARSSDLASSSDLAASSAGLSGSAASSELQDSAAAVEPTPGAATGDSSPPLTWEPTPTPPESARAEADDKGRERRKTGDLPSRPSAYTGRTGGSRRASSQLDPGTVLYGRYEIVKRIGGGGMGAVYYAKDRNLGDAPRAVKEMIQSHLDESQQ
ncbi:MAG: hypothetical protein DMF65_03640, partial [Acidobacteria bacterium]